ncbi:MAG: type I methionyl aminopeptidase [Actinomycetota bacterium]|nr:type I methionyl aminopeptidase [Actinomycetota bacterium]
MFNKAQIQLKTPEQFETMRKAGRVVALCLEEIQSRIKPGMTTLDLDLIARNIMDKEGAKPSFLGYHGFPAVICVSVNEEVVHGIPRKSKILNEGDLVSIDCGAIINGWHGDAAITIGVGNVKPEHQQLSEITKQALQVGINASLPGNHVGDIGFAIENFVRSYHDLKIGILEDYVGHGIGTEMHMAPSVPNYGKAGTGVELVEGMAIAIEPMLVLGSNKVHVLEDDWTVVSSEGSFASHWENTIAITKNGPEILTKL